MPKLFVVSDVHGFYDELIDALNKAGFDKDNPNHYLISCGDTMDRGGQPAEVMHYLKNLPRKVLIKGNHESLIEECIEQGYWRSHDMSNGTFDTICELGAAGKDRNFEECCVIAESRVKDFFASMVNYFETKNYIFVHGWIPLTVKDKLPLYYTRNRIFEYNPDWRHAHHSEWEQARWLNGIDMSIEGFVEPGKTIICGHWHCSYGHMLDSTVTTRDWQISEFGDDAIWDPYYGDCMIAIDRCTAHTGEVNVLVIEDEFLEDDNE